MAEGAVAGFVVVMLLLVFTPGADWAYVVAVAAEQRSPWPAAVAGVASGYVVHTAAVAAGVAALVATRPGALAAVTVVGAGYLVVLGTRLAVRPGTAEPEPERARGGVAADGWRVALRGVAVSGMNPKGLLLYVAVVPQFVDPAAAWPVAAQTVVLGGLHMAGCAAGYAVVGLVAGRALRRRPRAGRAVTRAAGVAMVAVGVLLVAAPMTRG